MPRPQRWPELLETFISTAQRDALKAIAAREGQPINVVVRRAIDREVTRCIQSTQRNEEIA